VNFYETVSEMKEKTETATAEADNPFHELCNSGQQIMGRMAKEVRRILTEAPGNLLHSTMDE
jgi:hypothetical protein